MAVMIVCAFLRDAVFRWASDERYVWPNKSDVVGVHTGVRVLMAVGSVNFKVAGGDDLTFAGDTA